VLDTAYFDGKGRNFTLEDFCGKLKKAFADLEECGEVTSEDRKVRIFLRGLRSPELSQAKSQILATQALYSSVDEAMNFAKTIENANESTKGVAHRNISSLKTGGDKKGGGKFKGKGKGKGGRFKGKVKGNSSEEQQAMREARDKAGITGKRKAAAVSTDESDEPPGKRTVYFNSEKEKKGGIGDSMSRK
jgi:hypothetical protein